MSRFDCNIDSPSCTLPANTGESAPSGGGGGGASNIHIITSTSEWTTEQANVNNGDTVIITGTGDYTISTDFTRVDFVATTGTIIVGGIHVGCNFRASTVKFQGIFAISESVVTAETVEISGSGTNSGYFAIGTTVSCARVDYKKTGNAISIDPGATIKCMDFYGTGTADIVNDGTIQAQFLTSTIRNQGIVTVTNQNFSSSNLTIKNRAGNSTTITKNTGNTLMVLSTTIIVNA